MSKGKECFKALNCLTCLAQGLTGYYTTVDLRNDSFVSGKLDHVDGFMNVVVSDAVYTDTCGNEYFYDLFFVKERNVRYIHIPEEVDIYQTIHDKVSLKHKRLNPIARPVGIKQKRLLQRQKETLARVEVIKRERLSKK